MSGALQTDLIAAVATPPGQGGVGMLRVSGPGAYEAVQQLIGRPLRPRVATLCDIAEPDGGEIIDQGLALWFPAPGSFTGEDVVELQSHGSPVVLQRLLDAVCTAGARLARPGEFSERAFLNGKMDLAQAEAVADLIASTSIQAARAAMRSMRGEFSEQVNGLAQAMAELRTYVEACIDFPDEEVEFLQSGQILERCSAIGRDLGELLARSEQGRLLNEGVAIAIVGAPNAGKSSLLNVLTGEDAAIVTDIPGTTRDLLRVDMVLDGLAVRLVDTAGIRDASDQVETIGIDRARQQARLADLVVVVLDATEVNANQVGNSVAQLLAGLDIGDERVLVVMNKLDLLAAAGDKQAAGHDLCWVSALRGDGLDELRASMLERIGARPTEAEFTARARHVEALQSARDHVETAIAGLGAGHALEVVAEELWAAHNALGEIVGTMTPDDLLGRIFSEFCIGK